jgi:hypothetical protein
MVIRKLQKSFQSMPALRNAGLPCQEDLEDIGAMRVSFLKVAKPYLISLNGGLALKFI